MRLSDADAFYSKAMGQDVVEGIKLDLWRELGARFMPHLRPGKFSLTHIEFTASPCLFGPAVEYKMTLFWTE